MSKSIEEKGREAFANALTHINRNLAYNGMDALPGTEHQETDMEQTKKILQVLRDRKDAIEELHGTLVAIHDDMSWIERIVYNDVDVHNVDRARLKATLETLLPQLDYAVVGNLATGLSQLGIALSEVADGYVDDTFDEDEQDYEEWLMEQDADNWGDN